MRRLEGLALVALTLLVAPAPGDVAQAAPRPEPTELWRQFPLDTEPSNPVAPAESGPTSPAPAPKSGSTAGEGRGRSLPTVQIAAIVLAMALAFILTTVALAYVEHGPFGPVTKRRRRRLALSFPKVVDAPRVDRSAGRHVGEVTTALRRVTRRAAVGFDPVRAAAVGLHGRSLSAVGALRTQLGAGTVQTNESSDLDDVVASMEPPGADEPAPPEAESAHGVPEDANHVEPTSARMPLDDPRVDASARASRPPESLADSPPDSRTRARGLATYVQVTDDRIALMFEHGDPAVHRVICRVRDPDGSEWAAERVSVLLPRRYGLIYPRDFNGASPLREGTFRVEWLRPGSDGAGGGADEQLATLEISPTAEDPVAGGSLKDRIALYLDPRETNSTAPANLDSVKAEPETHLAPPRTPADDELEVLKSKLGKPAAPLDDRRTDQVEMLKAKLARETAAQDQTPSRHLLKRKLAERRTPLKVGPKDADDAASLKAKLEVPNGPLKDETAASVELETRDGTRDETRYAVNLTPVPPSTASAASRASTAAPARRTSTRAKGRTQLGAAAPLELLRSPSARPKLRVAPEQLSLEQLRATRCRIVWRRGYFKSLFHAVARTRAGDEYVIAESPHFRWSKVDPPPENARAVGAHRFLLELLERDGWSLAGTGEHWFMLDLERRQARRRPDPGGERE